MSDSPRPFAAQLRIDLPAAAVRHVLEVFQTEMPKLADALMAAAANNDAEAFRKVAHGIAGSAGTVGAVELEQGARLAMAAARSRPDRIVDVGSEVVKLGQVACNQAAAVVLEIA